MAEALGTPAGSSRRWMRAGLALVAALAITWTVVSIGGEDHAAQGRATVPGRPIAENRPAPSFARPVLRGHGTISLSSYRGSVVVLNFWASWCHACRAEAPDLKSLAQDYRGRGVSFLGVDYEDGTASALAAARSFGLPYPSVVDPAGSVGDSFGIVGLPTTYILAPDQRVRYLIVGRIDPASFRTALDDVMARSAEAGA